MNHDTLRRAQQHLATTLRAGDGEVGAAGAATTQTLALLSIAETLAAIEKHLDTHFNGV